MCLKTVQICLFSVNELTLKRSYNATYAFHRYGIAVKRCGSIKCNKLWPKLLNCKYM